MLNLLIPAYTLALVPQNVVAKISSVQKPYFRLKIVRLGYSFSISFGSYSATAERAPVTLVISGVVIVMHCREIGSTASKEHRFHKIPLKDLRPVK